jgi:hypothetical protein
METHARWKGARCDSPEQLDGSRLVDWFVSHVSTMDFITARFIKAQGKG